MFRVTFFLIAALSFMSKHSTAQVLYGGGIEAGTAQTNVTKYKEVDKSGSTYVVHGGISLFATESSILTATLGLQSFSVEGKANMRTQEIKSRLGLLQLDYAYTLGGFEPGLMLRMNYGKAATLLASDKENSLLTTSIGPKFGYRWRLGDSDIVTYVAATFDVMSADQTKQAVLFGASYWIGRGAPQSLQPDAAATDSAPAAGSSEEYKVPDVIRINPAIFQFAANSEKLTQESSIKAEKLARTLAGMTVSWSAINIGGHSDGNSKNPKRNQEISVLRAATVRALLIAAGINPDSIVISGYGATEPLPGVDPNSPLNRRVELSLIGVSEPEKIAEALQEFMVVKD